MRKNHKFQKTLSIDESNDRKATVLLKIFSFSPVLMSFSRFLYVVWGNSKNFWGSFWKDEEKNIVCMWFMEATSEVLQSVLLLFHLFFYLIFYGSLKKFFNSIFSPFLFPLNMKKENHAGKGFDYFHSFLFILSSLY